MSGLNQTPKGERVQIALFGRRNAGKSSVINALTGQELAVVSEVKGTTTDPVSKAMELLPLGPVTVTDTPGLDDKGDLGQLRVQKAYGVLNHTEIALLVFDLCQGFSEFDRAVLDQIKARDLPHLIVGNQIDRGDKDREALLQRLSEELGEPVFPVSAATGEGIAQLKEKIASLAPQKEEKKLIGDLLSPNDLVVLVVPIDKAAPKGRLILPQQQTIRDILDAGAVSVVTKETELKQTLQSLGKKPKFVITDSQVFAKVAAVTPADIPMTSFSILMARYKGDLENLVRDVRVVDSLRDGDLVLISEGCTHHRQCDDIGTVKIPRWLKEKTGKDIRFETSSGTGFPQDLSRYRMVIHCGGCMLNAKEMAYRMACAKEQGIPMVNYGILIAYLQGILLRSAEPFPEVQALLKG
ncbi:[FeFe] hydrogenase H-cluster maturation GTPase HydF [Massiliimalia timonensis]|uniref:[FeFe] hydrogenase H-cluster maturation GTPase HydF n=1 Tax=Massiliimalia timonensis TaxID=1987501 RepID=UPI000B8AD6B1|nr:[FeFe] hydrogenase H-cluster maturation GTPase HydF [Massiliimalia timonensis]